MRRGASVSIALGALLVAATASASPDYPEAMKTDLGLIQAPGCDLCHHAAAAPVGAVDTPFGKSTVAHGLVGGDAASLATAFDGLRDDGVDSDGDGARDLDELSWGGNPNHADVPEGTNAEPVAYGCSFGKAPVGGAWALGVVGVIAALGAGRGRRRKGASGRRAR